MLCVIAKLDDAATRTLDGLRKTVLGEACGRPLYGHVTLATYTGDEEARFVRACRDMLADVSAFSLRMEKIEVLEETSVLVASPEESGPLSELHRRITAEYEDALDKWTRTGIWLPHITLFFGPEADLSDLCRRLSAAFTPFSARVCAIEFSRVLDAGYEIIDRVPLPENT